MAVMGVLLTACDGDALQWCGDACELEIATTRGLYAVGDEIPFEVTLWTSEPRPINLYDDPLCSIRFNLWLEEFEERSIRACKDVNPLLSFVVPDAQIGSTEQSSEGRHRVSYREAESVKTILGPDRRKTFELRAQTGADASGRLMVWFAEDVYFSFSSRVVIAFTFVPVTSPLASEPGAFRSQYMIEFEPRMVDGKQYVSLARKERSLLFEELKGRH